MNRMERLSHFKLVATTFYNMKPSYFYYIIQNHYQKGLDEKLLNTVSFAKDVLNNIKNACSNTVPLVCNNADTELRRLRVVLVNCNILV